MSVRRESGVYSPPPKPKLSQEARVPTAPDENGPHVPWRASTSPLTV